MTYSSYSRTGQGLGKCLSWTPSTRNLTLSHAYPIAYAVHFQVCFKPGIGNPKGCRALTRQSLDRMCLRAKCSILHKISNDYLDAYVLSESSLFVYPHKVSPKVESNPPSGSKGRHGPRDLIGVDGIMVLFYQREMLFGVLGCRGAFSEPPATHVVMVSLCKVLPNLNHISCETHDLAIFS